MRCIIHVIQREVEFLSDIVDKRYGHITRITY